MMKKLLDYWCKFFIAHPKELVFLTLVLFGYSISNAQIVINEVKETGSVELKNLGATTVDVSTYWLCDFPAYTRLDNASITVESGSLMLTAGSIVEISGFNFIDSADGELGLYSSSAFSNSAAMVDYIEWGSTGHQRSSVAVAAGTWTAGNYIPAFDSSLSIQYDGTGDTAADYGAYVSTLGAENGTCVEVPDGGMVTLADGTSTSYANCAGNIIFDVAHTTTAPNLSYWYIITDADDNILAWQNSANGNTLDLSAAPAGECHVWGWNYSGLPNPVVGANISTLSDDDCEDISDNFVTVYREVPDGGMVTLADGTSTSYANCAGNIVFDVAHTTTAPNLSYWYVITDADDNILAWQNSANGNTLDLSAAPAGECHVWGWNYRGLPDPVVGANISTLSDDDCEDISDNFVTVYREVPDGGMVTLADGTSTSYANCAGNIVFDVAHTTTAPNLSYWYVITDADDNILAWQNSANGNTLDLSAAPAGECHVWGWNYRGLPDPVVGANISTLSDDDCEDISDNFVTVYREVPDGGMVTLADGTSTSYANCAGNIVFDVAHTTTAPNLSYWYIITDADDNILAWQNSANGNTLDLSAAPAGECHVWGWNYRGLPDPVVGANISTLSDDDCEDISDNFVTVYREVPDGGMVTLADGTSTSYANCAGNIVFDVAHTTTAPNLSYWYVITDADDNILAWQNSANGNTLDLSAAPAGECHVWGWNYRGLPDPVVGANISTLSDDDCEDISDNFVTVYREVPDGGMVTLADGTSTSYANCAGNIVFDVAHTTTAPNLSYWYVITDADDNILAWQNSANGNTLDLSAAPAGECHVWGWNYRGLPDPVVGANISTLSDDDCEDISDNFVTVYREVPDGGMVTLADGTSTSYANCAGNIVFDVAHTTTAPNLSYWYVITDADDNILAWQNSANGNTLDLSAAPAGECHVWGWNYRGLPDPVVGANISTLSDDDCEDISDNFVTVYREVPDGGMVTLADGTSTSYANCAGNIVFDVAHTTTAPNLSYWYVITDADDNILAWQNSANGNTLDLSAAPAGECHVWGWNYRGLPDPVVGANISTLSDDDCEDISDNFVTVYREVPDGGMVTLADGTSTSYANCAGNIVFDVAHTTTAPNLSYWYVITDADDNILAWQNSANGNTLDLSAAPAGECHVWGWNYRGLPDPVVGANISTLSDDDCEDISDNFVTVYREVPDGGMVTLADGTSTSYANCAGNIVFDVAHTTTAPNLSYWYVITDADDNILAWQNSANGNTLDLSAAPAGECHVWGWNYRGLPDPVVGANISTLSDDDCEDISDNFVTVYREVPDGGMVTLADGTSTSYANCAGNIVFDVAHTTTAPNLSYWYVITDADDNILAWQNSANGNTLDLSAAPAGECHVWGWNYRGLPDPVVGANISTLSDDDCEDISDNFVTVYREVPDGGMVTLADGTSTSYANCAGNIVFDVAHTTTAPNLSYWYVITDADDNILAWQNSANGNTLDLSAAPAGECHVWGWNYRGLPDPVVGANISTLSDDDCEDISDNFVTVYREVPDGGMVTLADGTSTSYANCAGNIVFDVAHTTTAPNLSYWYIITDADDNILAWQNSANGNTLDLSAAPAGECHVWGWNYRGLPDPVVGANISTLSDDDCEDISDNFVTVYREVPDGGMVTLADGVTTTYTGDAGSIVFDVAHTTTAPNLSYWYIITDADDNILEWQNSANGNTLDLSAAPAGECHVWGWNYRGLPDPVVGANISTLSDDDCEDISDNFITVIRQDPLSVEDFENAINFTVYPNPASNILNLQSSSNQSYDVIIELFDVSGRRVYQDNRNLNNTIQLNIAPYQSGVYLLSIQDVESNARITKQIVKK